MKDDKKNFSFYWEEPMNFSREKKASEIQQPIIKIEVPGFTRDEIKVSMEKNILTVNAQKKSKSESKGKGFYSFSASSSAFSRSIALPSQINSKDLEINIKDGAVTLKKKKKVEENA
jgi:HSP20 family protein